MQKALSLESKDTFSKMIWDAMGGAGNGECASCKGVVNQLTTVSEVFGEITIIPNECNACREKDYQAHLGRQKSEDYFARNHRCCGYQNRKVKHQGEYIGLDDVRDGYTHQKVLSAYISDVIDGKEKRGAYIDGTVGAGKTFWAKVLHNTLVDLERDTCFLRAVDLAIVLRKETIKGDDYKQVLDHFKNVPVLIIDDFGTQKNTEWVSETIFAILDGRYENNKTTIITSNVPLERPDGGNERLSSRIGDRTWMRPVSVIGPDIRKTN